MKNLVTGATGSIGSNIVRKLVERGEEVRVMIRKTSNTLSIEGLDVERVYGDIRDYASVKAAVEGCRYVFHAAGISEAGVGREHDVFEVNECGALNVAIAAMEAGVERFVHTSSIAAVGWGTLENPATEETEYNFATRAPYWIAKRRSEEKILQLARESGFPAVVVNPSIMVGPWDVNLASGRMVVFAQKGMTYAYMPGGTNFVDIEDAALGHILARDKGRIGERYILGGENLTYKHYFGMIHEMLGKPKPFLPIPKVLGTLIGFFGDRHLRHSKNPHPLVSNALNSEMVKLFVLPAYVSAEKAIRELGFPQTPIAVSLEKQIKWLSDYGFIEPVKEIKTPSYSYGA
ncbi:MAG: NAD-dependent epimerase/dehydratase family protein [Deltaproteobacteria bacterium]|nr:MAG: NAD-dependent epimerase/dehydratase family protein [Deltaproteobacteria bacterium]